MTLDRLLRYALKKNPAPREGVKNWTRSLRTHILTHTHTHTRISRNFGLRMYRDGNFESNVICGHGCDYRDRGGGLVYRYDCRQIVS